MMHHIKKRRERMHALRSGIIMTMCGLLIVLAIISALKKPTITGAATTGTAMSRVIAIAAYNATCSIQLTSGWNLISIPCVPDNTSIESVFAGVLNKVESVHEYRHNYTVASGDVDQWKAYKPNLTIAVTDLAMINATKGYWVNMKQNAILNVTGLITLPLWIPVYDGYNLISYGQNESKNLTVELTDIAGSYTIIHLYNATDAADHWKSYNPNINSSYNDLVAIVPYHGYWINMSGNDTIIFGLYT